MTNKYRPEPARGHESDGSSREPHLDIERIETKPSLIKRYWYVFAALGIIGCFIAFQRLFGGVSYVADRDTLRTAQVERGRFYLDVRAHGVLKAKDTHWVASEVSGRVAKLLVRAGDTVSQNAPLLELRNPDVLQELERAKWDLALGQSQSMSVLNEQESQRLESEANVLTASLAHESAKLRLAAEDDLIKKGLGSLSPLEYRKIEFSVRETLDRMNMERKRLANLSATLTAQRKAEAARIQSLEAAVARAQRRVDGLIVRAPSAGIIQQISAELGQQLTDGNEVARIVNHEALYAELSVQELQVSTVAQGQTVLLDTRHSKLTGKVTRIDPAIRNGSVFVDVEITDPLPPEARPDLSIEGTIRTADVNDALFVVRPVGVQRNSTVRLYRLTDDSRRATRQPVQLGQSSVDHVQVLQGLTEGEIIIVSDTSAFKDHEAILIN